MHKTDQAVFKVDSAGPGPEQEYGEAETLLSSQDDGRGITSFIQG